VTLAARDTAESSPELALPLSRRALLSALAVVPLAVPLAWAEDFPSPTTYEDTVDHFSIQVPAGWQSAQGNLTPPPYGATVGSRRALAFYPTGRDVNEVNISVVITNVSVEFTKLGSFGNAAQFATNLVNSLDRSYLLRNLKPGDEPPQVAKLVDYEDRGSGSQYYIDYTIARPVANTPTRHLLSTVQIGNNGTYNRLYTVTAQCNDTEMAQLRPVLTEALKSFSTGLAPKA